MTANRLATRALVGAAVLCLAAGAASASGAHPASSAPIDAEAARLQQTWGHDVVRGATLVNGSTALLVATADQALLHAASPRRWLGTRFDVVLLNVADEGPMAGLSEDACGSMKPMLEMASAAASPTAH